MALVPLDEEALLQALAYASDNYREMKLAKEQDRPAVYRGR
jgi:hypothetical protein